MKHKFNVGDKVKIVQMGLGFDDDEVGKIVTISKLVTQDYMTNCPGYAIKESYGNFKHDSSRQFGSQTSVGETSFELYQAVTPSIKTKNTLKKSDILEMMTAAYLKGCDDEYAITTPMKIVTKLYNTYMNKYT